MSRDDELGPDRTDADDHDAPRARGDGGDEQPSTAEPAPVPEGRAARRKAERAAAAGDSGDAPRRGRGGRDGTRRDRASSEAASGETAGRSRTGPVQFLREVRSELRKVAWPSRRELVSYTLVVLSFSLVITLLTWGFDTTIREAIINTLG